MPPFRILLAAAGVACAAAAPERVEAQGRLDAHYEASLAGIPVGKGTWTIEVGDDAFSAAAKGGSSGLLQAFSGGSGTGASQGRVVNGALIPQSYAATTKSAKKSESIRMMLGGNAIRDTVIEPEPSVDADRVPVTDAHRKNVLDPMTGALLRVPGTGDPMTAESCRTTTPVFDGRMRYDLKLDFKRMETVRAETGYRGPALVCAIYFTPIAGYIPDRAAIKYLAAQRNMEVWFVPLPGTRVLIPYRVAIPTPLGTAVLEATKFVTAAPTPRAASRAQ